MSRIINIATAVPEHCHDQSKIAEFMSHIYQEESGEDNLDRKLKLLYERSGIKTRYSYQEMPEVCHGRRFRTGWIIIINLLSDLQKKVWWDL